MGVYGGSAKGAKKYTRQKDYSYDQSPYKEIEFENWTSLNFNPRSKMVKFHCHGRHQLDADYDSRKLIAHAFEKGFRKCCICKCYFHTTTKINCPCCNKQLQCKRRQPNRKYLNTGATKSNNSINDDRDGDYLQMRRMRQRQTS